MANNTSPTAPICEQCNIQMVERKNRQTGKKFYGCPNYPKCDETATHEDEDEMSYADYYNGRQDQSSSL